MVKRYIHADRWKIFLMMFKTSRARRSWLVSWKFIAAGINVPVPVMFGEKRIWRFLRESFIISEEIETQNLEAYLREFKPPMTAEKTRMKKRLIIDFARSLRRAHDRGFFTDDLSTGNILVKREGNGTIFWFVDFDGAKWRKRLSLRERTENLSRLNNNLRGFVPHTVTEQDKMEFLREYAGGDTDFFRALYDRLNKALSCKKNKTGVA